LTDAEPALERRRMAYPKAHADFQSGITAGICDRRNGASNDKFALQKILNGPCPLWVLAVL
jgi:hypothetical protein